MTTPGEHPRDELLEAYLDGLLDERARADFTESLRTDPVRRRQVELQQRIDYAMGQLFHVETPTREQLAAALAAAAAPRPRVAFRETPAAGAAPSPRPSSRLYWGVAGVAAAAAIAWAIAAFTGSEPGSSEPVFAARPLVEIYRDAVASGFEPSYDCREPERFAAAFSQRQGQPLRLLELPQGMTMLGLGYFGGLSRYTTAMLCRVDNKPVIVFVDLASLDQPLAAKAAGNHLHIFRKVRDGLVYYEVTPFDEPRVTNLFAPATLTGEPTAGAPTSTGTVLAA
jgi:hypothetical protein